ncbi:MAG: serine/threonine-protein kinase [Pseudomonadota bacterium]
MSEVPSKIGQYEVLGVLGSGGMAEVYLGRHTQLGNAVAIKVLDARYDRDPSFRQRFVDEARIQANLKHGNILAVQDIIAEEDLTAIVMEYLDGVELSLYLKSRSTGMPTPQFLALILPLADALAYAHEAGIVHRDIKPSNVFLARQGRLVVPKLMDFGIAKLLDASIQSQQTAAGAVLGTPQFMAPEQFEDASTVDARADVFAAGSLMYLLLARRLPFRGEGISEIMRRVLMETPEALTAQRDDLPPGLEEIVFRCLEKRPADRYQTMAELVVALQEMATRVPAVPLEPGDLPESVDEDGLRSKVGLASTTGETLTRRKTHADEPEPPPTIPSRHAMPAVRPEGSGGVILPGPPPEKPRRSRTGLWVLLVLLIGGAAGVGTVMYLHQGHVDDSSKDAPADDGEGGKIGPSDVSEAGKAPRRVAESPARSVARAPRGEWPGLPAASKVQLGSRLHHPPKGELDRHLSALLALGWEGLESGDLEDGEEVALWITAGDLAAWVREMGRTPIGRRLLPHVEKAVAPVQGKGLKRSHLDHIMEILDSPDASRYVEFQVSLQCETFRLVDEGQGDQLGKATDALLAQKGLTFDIFQRLKTAYGKDPLLKAEIAARALACITEK